jgi:hypothetical protein
MKKGALLLITAIIVFLFSLFSPSFAYGYNSSLQNTQELEFRIGDWKFGISDVLKYVFKEYQLDDFLHSGIWRMQEDGFQSGFGLMFIENPYESYEITLIAQLGIDEQNNGVAGGFGLLFETEISSDLDDSGYVMQFDRGYGGILIRPRNKGAESRPILIATNKDNQTIPQSKRDPYWIEEKEITIRITKHEFDSSKKVLNLWVDGVQIFEDFVFDISSNHETKYTGFRSWGAKTEYRILEIKDLT